MSEEGRKEGRSDGIYACVGYKTRKEKRKKQ
jgi:hypothetical protein